MSVGSQSPLGSAKFSRFVRVTVGSSAFYVLIAIASLIAMSELDRLIGEVLAKNGRTHTLSGVIGLAAGTDTDAWADWRSASFNPSNLIVLSTVFDLVFIVAYFVLLRRLAVRALTVKAVPPPREALTWPYRFIVFLVAADVLEDAVTLALAFNNVAPKSGESGSLLEWLWMWGPPILATLSYLKWSALAVLILHFVLRKESRHYVRSAVRTAWLGLYAQRLVAIVVAGFAVVSLVTHDGVLEQVADIYRGWIVYVPPVNASSAPVGISFNVWAGWLSSLVAFALTGTALFFLARQRVRHYATIRGRRDRGQTSRWWIFAAAVLGAGLLIALLTSGTGVDFITWGSFLGAIVLIPAVSLFLRKHSSLLPKWRPSPELSREGNLIVVRKTGDFLVSAWIVIWAFGPYKAFLAPLFLGTGASVGLAGGPTAFDVAVVLAVLYVIAGITLTLLFRWVVAVFSDRVDTFAQSGEAEVAAPRRFFLASASSINPITSRITKKSLGRATLVAGIVSGVVLVGLLIFPMHVAYIVGPIATIVVLAGCWATLIGVVIIVLGRNRPLELFRLLRLRSTPIISLLLIIPIAITFTYGQPSLHAIQTSSVTASSDYHDARLTLAPALNTWYKSQKCSVKIAGGGSTPVSGNSSGATSSSYVPLVLIAAEGGGIRAAAWTIDVLRQLASHGGCAQNASFASSGASGGSIGLASFRQPANRETTSSPATATVPSATDIAGPGPLAADLTGLFDGDLVGSLTGIRVPSLAVYSDAGVPTWAWRDRTAMLEDTWRHDAPQFAGLYDTNYQSPTGYLLLNSMDAVTNCKVLISQLDLTDDLATGPAITTNSTSVSSHGCSGPDAPIANTIDFQNYIGDCIYDLSWATTAVLSARFPYVSPAGRISRGTLPSQCVGKNQVIDDMQLVDGGVMENTGLSTLAELAPRLARDIQQLNSNANGASKPFIVPVVLYLENDPGFDVSAAPDRTRPDILVPSAAQANGPAALSAPAAWLSRLSSDLLQVCPVNDSGQCSAALKAARNAVKGGVAVAYPSTSPAVSVPLGWTLSSFTSDNLETEAAKQATCTSSVGKTGGCHVPQNYAPFGDLLALLTG